MVRLPSSQARWPRSRAPQRRTGHRLQSKETAPGLPPRSLSPPGASPGTRPLSCQRSVFVQELAQYPFVKLRRPFRPLSRIESSRAGSGKSVPHHPDPDLPVGPAALAPPRPPTAGRRSPAAVGVEVPVNQVLRHQGPDPGDLTSARPATAIAVLGERPPGPSMSSPWVTAAPPRSSATTGFRTSRGHGGRPHHKQRAALAGAHQHRGSDRRRPRGGSTPTRWR